MQKKYCTAFWPCIKLKSHGFNIQTSVLIYTTWLLALPLLTVICVSTEVNGRGHTQSRHRRWHFCIRHIVAPEQRLPARSTRYALKAHYTTMKCLSTAAVHLYLKKKTYTRGKNVSSNDILVKVEAWAWPVLIYAHIISRYYILL